MADAKHTPGPWTYVENIEACYAFGTNEGWEVGNADEQVGLAFVPGREANARLIAAAPDLLAALEALVAQALDYEKVNNLAPNLGRTYCWDTVERAVKVIAKATA
jgi:hypothetical protein